MANQQRKMTAGSRAKHRARRQSDWPGLAIGGLVVLAVVLGVFAAFDHYSRPPAIVGKWVNSKGGELNFYANGRGMIPAAADVPTTTFTYRLPEATQLVMDLGGQTVTMTIQLAGDQLTWFTSEPNVKYEYTRAR